MPTQRLVHPVPAPATRGRRGAHLATAIMVTLFMLLLAISIALSVTGLHTPAGL